MRSVSFFPPYSQEENVVTNAVLLLLAQVNRLAPTIFSELLTSLTDEEYSVGPTFHNQIKISGGKGIPDALIQQIPFEIYVETKLGDDLLEEQISNHFETIKINETVKGSSILLGLTRSPLSVGKISDLKNIGQKKGVRFFAATFADLAEILKSSTENFRTDLNGLIDEYSDFIQERDLFPQSENKLLVNPCGTSFEQNMAYNIYYDQPTRSKVFCKYIGLYRDKAIHAVGEVQSIINARIKKDKVEIIENHQLSWQHGKIHQPNDEELGRVLGIVQASDYYNLADEETRYYIVERFVKCTYAKTSPYGLQGHRYVKLDGEKGVIPECFKSKTPTINDIASSLSRKTWK